VDYSLGALTPDDEIISIAVNENRIIVTKDFDFFDYFLLKNYPPAIFLLQLGNIKNNELFVFLEKHLETVCELFTENRKRMILINHYKILIY
jgi:predicted nuclease of predicted toxin-antitoxin system